MSDIRFTVYGEPAGKGSTTAFYSPKQKRTFTHSPKSTVKWEQAVNLCAQAYAPAGGLLDGPLEMHLQFFLPKPKSAPKTRRTWPDKKPDLDKLIRAVGDALTNVIYKDDARIVSVTASKDYDVTPRVEVIIAPVGE